MPTPHEQEFQTAEQMAEASRFTSSTGNDKKKGHPEKLIDCEVSIDLTDQQQADVAADLARKTIEKGAIQQEAKDAAAASRKQVKALRKDIKRLAEEYESKSSKVQMQCVEVQEFPTRVAIYRLDLDRSDKRALISERPLTKDELHVPMFKPGDLGAADKAAGNDGGAGGAPANDGSPAAAPPGRKRTKKPKDGEATTH